MFCLEDDGGLYMGQGSYVLCEWDSVAEQYPNFQQAFASLEQQMIQKCGAEWAPKQFGKLTPNSGQFGRTTILPALFFDNTGTRFTGSWRQNFASRGHQLIITGNPAAGYVIPEDFKVAWLGLAFPNKQQHITEIKFQIGDRKYGRIDIEEIKAYNKPALIFEEGFIIDEEQAFELWGYVEGPIPNEAPFIVGLYQNIVMIGAAYYKLIDKVLGNCGAAIT